MLDSRLRPKVERLLVPVADRLAHRLGPNAVTAAGFSVGLACIACILLREYHAALALWVANRLLDGLDGTLARRTARQTDFGGYLDLLLDFVVYALLPLAVAASVAGAGNGPLLAAGALLASFYLNAASWLYLAALLEKRGASAKARTSIVMPPGLIEGTETFVFFTLFLLFPDQSPILMWIMAGLVLFTAAQRPFWAYRQLEG